MSDGDGEHGKVSARRCPALWVNDIPVTEIGEHGFAYDPDRSFPVEVSFEATNGHWVRASFDPQTGIATFRTLKPAGVDPQ